MGPVPSLSSTVEERTFLLRMRNKQCRFGMRLEFNSQWREQVLCVALFQCPQCCPLGSEEAQLLPVERVDGDTGAS